MFRFAILIVVFLGIIYESAVSAQEVTWHAGLATVKITPDKPVVLSGYAARTQPFDHVEQDIYAKALALRDEKGTRAVLFTTDLTGIPSDVADEIRQRISDKAKLRLPQIILSVSHDHSAPTVALRSGHDGEPTSDKLRDTIAYTRQLEDKIVSLASEALAKLQPAKLSWGLGIANFAINRREFTDRGVILGFNPHGPVDRGVPVLRIDSPDGTLSGVVFGYACHNTTIPSKYLGVSGDYAGYAQAYVQEHNPGAVAMFMIGCAGDANPYPREKLEAAPAHGEELGKEVCRVLTTKLSAVRGPINCAAQQFDLPLQSPDRESLQKLAKSRDSLTRADATRMLAMLGKGESLPKEHRATVGVWQFGNDLTLVALPDEVVVDYVQDIQEAIGPLRLWIAAYCNGVDGYIPSRRVLREGGYETRGLYIGTGWFAPEVEQALTDAVQKVAAEAGRKTASK